METKVRKMQALLTYFMTYSCIQGAAEITPTF